MTLRIEERLIPKGTAARPQIKRTGHLGITIHETGNRAVGANAHQHMLYMTKNGGYKKQVSYHYVVDDTIAYRLVPEVELTWHAGDGVDGDGNNKTISIEICVNADGNREKAVANAIELSRDILSRNGGKLFQHNHWSGKDCPQDIRKGKPIDWKTFVERATKKTLPKPPVQEKPTTPPKPPVTKPVTPPTQPSGNIVVGSTVRPLRAVSYEGVSLAPFVLNNNYKVKEVRGSRVVLHTINTAFNVKDLRLVSGGATPPTNQGGNIVVGSTVRPIKAITYENVRLAPFVLNNNYRVIEVKGNRLVLDKINSSIHVNNVKLVR